VVPLTLEKSNCPAVSPSRDARFSVDGNVDGLAEWLEDPAANALLAIDSNANGVIDDATELVSNRMDPKGHGAFDVLVDRALASGPPMSAVIEPGHPLHSALVLWADANRNGRSEPSEIRPASAFFARIRLGTELFQAEGPCRSRGSGVTLRDWRGEPRPNDRIHYIYEVVLRIRA